MNEWSMRPRQLKESMKEYEREISRCGNLSKNLLGIKIIEIQFFLKLQKYRKVENEGRVKRCDKVIEQSDCQR